MSTKSIEQRVRRSLYNMGYQLLKSRSKNWTYENQCEYMVKDLYNTGIVVGARYDYSLTDIIEHFGLKL